MSKYDPLNKWLLGKAAGGVSTVATTFQHIETVLGFELPSTARKKAQWWGNEAVDTSMRFQPGLAWGICPEVLVRCKAIRGKSSPT